MQKAFERAFSAGCRMHELRLHKNGLLMHIIYDIWHILCASYVSTRGKIFQKRSALKTDSTVHEKAQNSVYNGQHKPVHNRYKKMFVFSPINLYN